MAEGRVVQFKCMRCGHEYEGVDDPNVERQCPRCRSNSVRKLRKKKRPKVMDNDEISPR